MASTQTLQDVKTGNELLTVGEVSELLRVDSTTVRRWIKLSTLKAVSLPHVGKRQSYRVRRSTIDEVLNGSANSDYEE